MYRCLLLLLIVMPGLALADSGRILYVTGQVTVERDGRLYRAVKNARVIEGDTIETGTVGRLHLRMSDRTLVSLKPDTRFTIEAYRYAGAAAASAAPTSSTASDSGDRSLFRLVKGGFRAITGLIGQRDKSAFGVNTPVATIGIRGTSFVADLEVPANASTASASDLLDPEQFVQLAQVGTPASGSAPPPDTTRLTVGVGDGAVILSNAGGTLVLENGEYGQVTSDSQAPYRLLRPVPDDELGNEAYDDEDIGMEGDDTQTQIGIRTVPGDSGPTGGVDGASDGEAEETVPEGSEPVARRNLALASALSTNGARTLALTIADDATITDASGNVIAFVTGVDNDGTVVPAVLALDDGSVINQGAAPELDLRWGRWSGAAANLRFADGGQTALDPTTLNLHLIQSASSGDAIAVPATGSRDYVLIGNTDPTSGGVSGFLGHASLSADFDNQTVGSQLNLSVDAHNWQAGGQGSLGSGLGAGTPAHIFSGTYNDVRLDGAAGGTGDFSGFFTPEADGAGLSYRLEHSGESVHGAAAFEAVSP